MGWTGEGLGSAKALSCATCGRVATCIGAREGGAREEPACNGCCGHGGEDGSCRPVEGGFYILCLKEPRNRAGLLWWKPERSNYTVSLDAAGVYTADEAYEICRSPSDCAAIPVLHARLLSWPVVTDSLLQAVLSARADRQDGAAPTRADGTRAAAGEGEGRDVSMIAHGHMWRLEMRSGEVVPVAIEPDRHRSIAIARGYRAGGQSPYMATMQLALFASSTDDPVVGVLAPWMADWATIAAATWRVTRCEADLKTAQTRYAAAKAGEDQVARLEAYGAMNDAEARLVSARQLVPALLLTRVAAPPGGSPVGPFQGPASEATARPDGAGAHPDCPTCLCGRRARVQRSGGQGPGTIAWSEHLQAWSAYAARHGTEQSADRIHERGGFGYDEVKRYLGHDPTTWRPLGR